MDKDQLKRHIQKSDLTAIEKRYLESLVDAQCKTDGRRLIDADALFKCDTCYHKRNGACTTFCDTVESYRPDMSKLKIIEAEPVRHGYWIECDYKHMEHGFIETDVNGGLCCSECRTGFKKSELRIKSYCPNCGAKMDKEEAT